MSKAEERALEVYPIESHEMYDDLYRQRNAYVKGYYQAEKDNELTWEDVSKIISIDQQVCGAMGISDYTHNHQQAMEEVLRRFKDLKHVK